ncbi:hypothetical protein CPB86DRAFT_818481 [Serendipita vermifera]|nr:hypothetical protein CPB86DRAFT_818481 [Serendipita vermifera]
MSVLILRGNTTVETTTRGDCFLTDIPHLILEIKQNGQLIRKANLFSRESTRYIWDVDKPLVLLEVTADFTLNILIQIDEDDRQLIGSIELNGSVLLDTKGMTEIPLIHQEDYPDLILRTRVHAIEDNQEYTARIGHYIGGDIIQAMLSEGVSAYQDFESHGNVQSLDEAILKFERAANMTPENDPRLHNVLNNLGSSLLRRFERLGRVADMDNGIEQLEVASRLTPDGHPDKSSRLNNLGTSLQVRFGHFGNIADINSSVAQIQAAIDLTPDNYPDKPSYLNNLGISLQARFERLGNIADIESAITVQQAARPGLDDFGDLADIDSAINQKQSAVKLTPEGHPDKPMYLSSLGNSLHARFSRLGNLADIDSAITQIHAAIDLTPDDHPLKPRYLSILTMHINTLRDTKNRLNNIHPDKPGHLNDLGVSLQARFRRLGNLADLNRAIARKQDAVKLTQDGHPDKPKYLSTLGNSLQARFERLGNIADIDSAITVQQAAISLTPDDHRSKPMYLSNLGNSLQARFARLGNLADINSGITVQQAAVNLTPDSHPNKPGYLSNLGASLQIRFGRLRNLEDIDNAINAQQAAVSLTPDTLPHKPMYLNNVGNSLQTRFEQLENILDMDRGISAHQAAISLTPDDHPNKPMFLSNLGNSLKTRFLRLGNIADIKSAMNALQAAVKLTPDRHPFKASCSYALGDAFWARFRRLNSLEDSHTAIYYLSTATQSTMGSPSARFQAAQRWILIASLIKHQSLLEAYENALGLIPILAWLGLPMVDRHRHLVQMGGVAREAAAAAISLSQYDKALEWLEQGRSIVWNQILHLRTPVDALRSVDWELADRLVHVSRLLDHGIDDQGYPGYREEDAQRYRALTSEWESIIDQVRSLPNFSDFLKPLKVSRLIEAAQNGPVIVLNIAEERCDALALVAGLDEVVHIPLPNITSKKVTELRDELKDLLYSKGIRMRGERAAKKVEDSDQGQGCESILSELWNGVVKPVLDSLAFSPHPDILPRIWWCATGPLAFLPIHAAGIYSPGMTDSQTSDYLISSYTPTISTLLESPNHNAHLPFRLLSVVQPSAPGASHIPNTKQELECIQRCLGSREHTVLHDHQGTKERVLKGMSESSWLHLACHGSQRRDEPTKSALILEDGHLTLEEIIKLDLPSAEFAFLSACQTTTGEETLSDEAVHIAGGMLLAGYRGVVATMWSIQDEFYRRIMEGEERPDNRKAAEALHYSIDKLRKKEGIPLTSWIPFVHLDSNYHNALVLKDTTVELTTRDDSVLKDIAHLILVITQNGQFVDKVDLWSQESNRGVWNAGQGLVLREVTADFVAFVFMQIDEDDRHLLGFMVLNGPGLVDTVGRQYEITLMCQEDYPELVLRTKVHAVEDIQESMTSIGQHAGENGIKKMFHEGLAAYDDFESHGNLQNLDKAISTYESVAEMMPESHPELYTILSNLGSFLMRRFELLGRKADMNSGIERLEMAAGLTPDIHKPTSLNNLGTSLQTRFEQLGNLADLESAITALQSTVNLTPDGHPKKPMYLGNLGISLQIRFDHLGNISDMENGITSLQAAVDLTPDDHPNKHYRLNNLGSALIGRFERIGNLVDIDRAISILQVAFALTPDGHPDKSDRWNNLGNSLQIRFQRLENLTDIDSAITALQAAVGLAPDIHPKKPMYLSNLGDSLQRRFRRLQNLPDIDSATTVLQAAVDLTPDGHPSKPGYLTNLANSLQMRFERLENLVDLDSAITAAQAAVALTPDGHPDKPSALNNLGNSLQTRFERIGNLTDMDSAITALQAALDLTPESHPYKCTFSYNLGNTFWARFRHLKILQDSYKAMHHFSAAAQLPAGLPSARFHCAQRWISIASLLKHQSLLEAYECAVGLMPIVAWLGLPIANRHRHLVEMGGIARNAAAAAISLGQYDKALEWLEQGRSIVWNQILQLRTPVDELRSVDSELADRLLQVSRLLDRGINKFGSLESTEEDQQRHRALTSEWESIVEQVRSLPNFKDFLRPLKISRLMDAAQNGPVVVLNIAWERCDALALTPGFEEVVHIPLPNITAKRVAELRSELKDLIYSKGIRMRGERAAKRVEDDDQAQDCERILSELWNGVVKPVLDSLAFSAHPDILPRIWWCATGPLAFLPIHAAGIYSPDAVDSQTSDYVISSYTPTISALLEPPNRTPPSIFTLALVIQPSAPGATQIPCTQEELECIRHRLGDRDHFILNDREGTKQWVMNAMTDSSWLHLACHGVQRQDEPTKSALILEDGHLTLEEIIKLDLPSAEFAFLSACQTTTGEETLSDEAVHIAGGMLLAGYRGVVATMWSIQDDLAPEVADEFYRRIMEDEGRPDNRKAAEALHYSVERLRKKGGIPLTSWIPFVHLGV